MKRFSRWWHEHRPSTMKLIVWIVLINGIAWTWCSYYLAYRGAAEIAEALSKVVVTDVLGVTIVYAVKSLSENLSKYNSRLNGDIEKTKLRNNSPDCETRGE